MRLEVVAVGRVNLDLGLRVKAPPLGQPPGEHPGGIGFDAADAHEAGEPVARGFELAAKRIFEVENLPGVRLKQESFVGERHPALGAFEKHGVVLVLELLNAPRERGLGKVEAFGGARDAAGFADRKEGLQASDVHGAVPSKRDGCGRRAAGGILTQASIFYARHGTPASSRLRGGFRSGALLRNSLSNFSRRPLTCRTRSSENPCGSERQENIMKIVVPALYRIMRLPDIGLRVMPLRLMPTACGNPHTNRRCK